MRVLIVLFSVLAVGCMQPPVQVQGTNNANIDVEQLFTHDGCRVYRFRDGGIHYFVRCDGAVSQQTMSMKSCGKNCTYEESIATAP